MRKFGLLISASTRTDGGNKRQVIQMARIVDGKLVTETLLMDKPLEVVSATALFVVAEVNGKAILNEKEYDRGLSGEIWPTNDKFLDRHYQDSEDPWHFAENTSMGIACFYPDRRGDEQFRLRARPQFGYDKLIQYLLTGVRHTEAVQEDKVMRISLDEDYTLVVYSKNMQPF